MTRVATNYTIDALISIYIARQVADGDILAQGIATPLVMAGYLLAKHTHYCRETYPTIPRHSRAVFGKHIDFVSGLGHSPARHLGARLCYLISSSGQSDFAGGVIDPLGIRRLKTLSGVARKRALQEALMSEGLSTLHNCAQGGYGDPSHPSQVRR